LGSIIATAGAQGTTFEGSPMLSYLESVKEAELEALQARHTGNLKATGLKAEARLHRMGAISTGAGGLAKLAAGLSSTLLRS